MNSTEPVASNSETAFEPTDWRLAPVALALLGAFVFVLIALAILRVEFAGAIGDVPRKLTVAMPQPRLQVDPAADLTALRAREDHDLNTYYWIDRGKDLIHIPIDEAIKQVAAHGLAGFPQAAAK